LTFSTFCDATGDAIDIYPNYGGVIFWGFLAVRLRGKEGKSKEFVDGYNVFGEGRLNGIGMNDGGSGERRRKGRRCLDGV
jgi:hypothetical protein